jgi:hypothetical protein
LATVPQVDIKGTCTAQPANQYRPVAVYVERLSKLVGTDQAQLVRQLVATAARHALPDNP